MTDEKGDTVTELLGAYISMWNERNPQPRQTIGDDVFTPDALLRRPQHLGPGQVSDRHLCGRLAGTIPRLRLRSR